MSDSVFFMEHENTVLVKTTDVVTADDFIQ